MDLTSLKATLSDSVSRNTDDRGYGISAGIPREKE